MLSIKWSFGFIIGGLLTMVLIQFATGSYMHYYQMHVVLADLLTLIGGVVGFIVIGKLTN